MRVPTLGSRRRGRPRVQARCPKRQSTSTTLPVLRCQIDHRGIATPTQTDRTGATLLGKADWHCLAALLLISATLPASPVRYLAETVAIADRDLLLPKTGRVVLAGADPRCRERLVRRCGYVNCPHEKGGGSNETDGCPSAMVGRTRAVAMGSFRAFVTGPLVRTLHVPRGRVRMRVHRAALSVERPVARRHETEPPCRSGQRHQ